MRWVERVPTEAVACGSGALDVQADSETLALQISKLAASAYVTEQVSAAVSRSLRDSAELRQKLAPLPSPDLVYVLGSPVQLPGSVWRIPFSAFAVPRVASTDQKQSPASRG